MWTQLDKPSAQKMSFALAKEFRDMKPCPHDRPLRDARLKQLGDKFAKGEFHSCLWVKAYCEETKEWYRVNGKHTSTLFAGMNGQLAKGHQVMAIIEQYNCPTLEDVARLYSSFDSRVSVRSSGDINRVFAATNDEISDISGRIINLCVSGITFAKFEDDNNGRPSLEDRAAYLLEHPAFVRWVNALAQGEDARHVLRAPVIAAAFLTWSKSQKDSGAFWTLVRDGSSTDHRAPDRTLQKYLLRTSCSTGRGSTTGKSTSGRREMFVKCLHGWNAWRRGQTTDLKFHATAKTPAVH